MRMNWNPKYVSLLLPMVILLALIAYPMLIVQMGQEVYLETLPYDPTDLFRGDYVQLRYAISELDDSYFDDTIHITEEDMYSHYQWYAVLKKEGPIHVIDHLTAEKPNSGIYLKGSGYIHHPYRRGSNASDKGPYIVDMDYNINRYYLKEGTGEELEKASREGKILGTVKIYHGKGVLVDLVMNK